MKWKRAETQEVLAPYTPPSAAQSTSATSSGVYVKPSRLGCFITLRPSRWLDSLADEIVLTTSCLMHSDCASQMMIVLDDFLTSFARGLRSHFPFSLSTCHSSDVAQGSRYVCAQVEYAVQRSDAASDAKRILFGN
jgi:hypothetical protein